MIIDVHAHLELEESYENRNEVLKRAEEAGVKIIICNGIDPKNNRKILELSKKHSLIKAALGFYPCECDKVSKEEFEKELKFIKKNKKKIIAIGEIGLDKKWDNDFDIQQECFRELISLAQKLDIPIIVHSRMAEEKAIEIMEEMNVKKAVMHCFSGKKKFVQRCIDNKWSLTIPGDIIRGQQFQEMAKMIPLKQILTETDFPVKKFEPADISESLKKIAEIKGLDIQELSNIIFQNYQRLF